MKIRIICVVSAGLLVSGCTSVESRWQAAQQQNTVAAYTAFMEKCPKTPYASSARQRIEELRFDEAWATGTTEALEAYQREYPRGKNVGLVQERLAFEQAKRANTLKAYDAYLKKYAAGRYIKEANQLREESLWIAAAGQRSVGLLQIYLAEYPEGKHRPAATAMLAELYWDQAQTKKSIAAYRNYIDLLPSGPHADSAQEAIAWADAEAKGTIEAFQAFLSNRAEGPFSGRAKENIQLLQKGVVGDREILKKIEAGLLLIPTVMKACWRQQGMWPRLSSAHPLIVKLSPTSRTAELYDLRPTGTFHGVVSADDLSISLALTQGSTSSMFSTLATPDNSVFTITKGHVRFEGYLTIGDDRIVFSGEVTYPEYDRFTLPDGLRCTLNADSYQFTQGAWRYCLPAPIFSGN